MLGEIKKPLRVAINGFGRIGRIIARQILLGNLYGREDMEIVAVNDIVAADNLAYLLKFDSTHGVFESEVTFKGDEILIHDEIEDDDIKIKCLTVKDGKFPWKELGVDLVFECTGFLLTKEAVQVHLDCGAKKVIIGAPAKDDTPMFVYGVNHEDYKGESIISMASCTTNCLAPIMKVLDREFGVEEALMCTIHSITATQRNLDGPSKKDFRGGRSCGESIIPSSTGAAKAVAKVLPQLKGKITGNSYRVPTKDVSIVDLTVKLSKDTSLEEILGKFRDNAAEGGLLDGVLDITSDEVVSTDMIGSYASSIVDEKSCIQLNPRFFKIVSWYDNEWGYSARMIDTAHLITQSNS